VSLCQHEDLIVDRFDLLHQNRYEDRATPIAGDIRSVSPETEVRRQRVEFRDPWAFGDAYGALHDFAACYPFDPENESYPIHVTTGTHVAQICLFILIESRYFPARLIPSRPLRRLTGQFSRSQCRGHPDGDSRPERTNQPGNSESRN